MALNQTRPVHDAPTFILSVASTLYNPGDLLYESAAGVASPAGDMTDQLSEADNQKHFAKRFLGVCGTQKLASDATTTAVQVITNQEYQFTAASATYAVGTFLAADEAASGTALEDQQVKATTDPAAAIAAVTAEAAATTTKVWGRMLSKLDRAFYQPGVGLSANQWIAQTIDMADAAVTLTRVAGTPTGTYMAGNLLLVDANSGTTENLLLPPEGDMTNELILIENTGGETINLQNDAGGAVATIATATAAFAHCDGTTWTAIQAI